MSIAEPDTTIRMNARGTSHTLLSSKSQEERNAPFIRETNVNVFTSFLLHVKTRQQDRRLEAKN